MKFYFMPHELKILFSLGNLSKRTQFYDQHHPQSHLYHQKDDDKDPKSTRTRPICMNLSEHRHQDVDQIED